MVLQVDGFLSRDLGSPSTPNRGDRQFGLNIANGMVYDQAPT
jgi:hypothetical protein